MTHLAGLARRRSPQSGQPPGCQMHHIGIPEGKPVDVTYRTTSRRVSLAQHAVLPECIAVLRPTACTQNPGDRQWTRSGPLGHTTLCSSRHTSKHTIAEAHMLFSCCTSTHAIIMPHTQHIKPWQHVVGLATSQTCLAYLAKSCTHTMPCHVITTCRQKHLHTKAGS